MAYNCYAIKKTSTMYQYKQLKKLQNSIFIADTISKD